MELPRLFYRLPELVERWGKTQDDILHMAAAGELALSVRHSGRAYFKKDGTYKQILIYDEFIQLRRREALQILLDIDGSPYSFFVGVFMCEALKGYEFECHCLFAGVSGDLDHLNLSINTGVDEICATLHNGPNVIVIMADEVARVEIKYPELRGVPVTQESLPNDPIIAVGWRGKDSIPKMLEMSQASVRKYAEMAGIDLESLKQKSGQGKDAIHLKLSHQIAIMNAHKKYNNS